MVGDLQQMASFLSSGTWGEPLPYSCQTLCLSHETLLPGPSLCGWGCREDPSLPRQFSNVEVTRPGGTRESVPRVQEHSKILMSGWGSELPQH